MNSYGFIRAAAASPKLKVADPEYNIKEITKLIRASSSKEAAVIVFPELCMTGYTCGDLFGQKLLLDKSLDCLAALLKNTADTSVMALIGMPLLVEQKLYNCAVVIQHGEVLGVVPKIYPANYKEFYENRWFSSGQAISKKAVEISLLGHSAPFGSLIFKCAEQYALGVEICEDLWTVIPPSSYMVLNGANIIANLSASNELVSKSDYRRQLVVQQSARCLSGYIYASSGVHESTTDIVFGGDCIIAENGNLLKVSERFNRENSIIYSEIDIERLISERQVNRTYADNCVFDGDCRQYRTVNVLSPKPIKIKKGSFNRTIHPHPFVPENPLTRDERCAEIFNIQVAGLAKRIEHTGLKYAVIGVSGGLDSTLALLAAAKTFKILNIPLKNILAVTMPGFGTTDTTYANAVQLMKSLKVKINEINIEPACLQHFSDIGQDAKKHDTTFENVQARERTQILMDMANKVNGLVIGTGDLSELALGWATYNGDHMSMYGVNCGIPKTLVKFLVKWVADNVVGDNIRVVLDEILNTPISPELLPPDSSGKIQQKTEEVVGPYELHDFFLYYAIRHGMAPQKILVLAELAFDGRYSGREIKKWLKVFYERFFSQQYKRSCLPDGPKVGTVSLSPRGDWRMPSDAEASLWLKQLTQK